MIRLHALDKFFRGGVNILGFEENLRGAAPAGDDARNACPLAEILDVFLDLQRELVFILALLDVGAVQLLDVVVTKRGLHGLDAREEAFYFFEVLWIEDAGVGGGLISVVAENVPAAENDIFELGKGNEFLDQRRTAFGSLAQADGAELRERADGLRLASPDEFDSSHERGADGAHARCEDSELPLGRRNLARFIHASP